MDDEDKRRAYAAQMQALLVAANRLDRATLENRSWPLRHGGRPCLSGRTAAVLAYPHHRTSTGVRKWRAAPPALHARQRSRHPVAPDGGADRPRPGPTVVVENRPGGGTVIGTEAAARAEPDGSTVLLVANSFVVNPALKQQNYDPVDQLRAGLLSRRHAHGAGRATAPRPTGRSPICSPRRAPNPASCRSRAAVRHLLHIAIEVLKRAANINITYVPYGGTAPAINALMGGPRDRGVRRLSDRGVAAQGGHAARARHRLAARVEPLPDVPTLTKPASPSTRPTSSTAWWRRRRRRPTRSRSLPAGSPRACRHPR